MKLNASNRLRAQEVTAKSQFEIAEDPLKVTLTIGGEREQVERVLALLYLVERNGAVGHSGTFGITWDGDGSDRIDLEGPELEPYKRKFHDLAETLSSYGGQVEVVAEGCTGFVISNDPEGGHYVKSRKVYPEPTTEK